MSTTAEPIVDPIVETPAVSTQIVQDVVAPVVEEPVSNEPVSNEPVSNELPVTETEEEEATAVVPTTEEIAAKPTGTKRRTIFNPFGKTAKKEDIKEEVVAVAEEISTATEEKAKKATKGFGFFSRSKSTPKVNEEENIVVVESETATTELPQIEPLQPIETENVTGSENEATTATTAKEAVAEIAENVEQEVNEIAQEIEQSANNLTTSVANKRQSFISKLFGSNKSKKQEKEVTSAEEEVVVEADTTTTNTATEEVVEQQTEEEEEEAPAHQRPSSPLGRLTELFTSKKNNKKAAPAAKEEAPAVIITDVEQDVAQTTIEENTNVTATPVVTASA